MLIVVESLYGVVDSVSVGRGRDIVGLTHTGSRCPLGRLFVGGCHVFSTSCIGRACFVWTRPMLPPTGPACSKCRQVRNGVLFVLCKVGGVPPYCVVLVVLVGALGWSSLIREGRPDMIRAVGRACLSRWRGVGILLGRWLGLRDPLLVVGLPGDEEPVVALGESGGNRMAWPWRMVVDTERGTEPAVVGGTGGEGVAGGMDLRVSELGRTVDCGLN